MNQIERIYERYKVPMELQIHMRKVAQFSILIGGQLNIRDDNLIELYIAAMLHDVGKVKVPSDVLYKREKITIDEFDLIKKHTNYSKEILIKEGVKESIVYSVLCHHEKFDGSGYPLKIKGEDIPIFSRIISVADAFDAMTSQRGYNKAKNYTEALNEIRINANKQFDPKVVNIFESSICV